MDNYSLDLFLNLAETLHFGKTSAACYISPSALSRQIQRMEEAVGEKLFIRDNRSVRLTHAGELFRSYARDVVSRWQSLEDQLLRDSGELKGEISLYCSVTACYTILPPVLNKFRQIYPRVHLKLDTGDAADAIKKVINEEVDLTIAARPDKLPANCRFYDLTGTPLVFVAPADGDHSLAGKKRILWKNVPFILPEHGLARKRTDSWFRKKELQPNIYAEVSGNEAILAMVSLGCGIGVVPELVYKMSPLKGQLRVLDARPPLKPYTVGICSLRRVLEVRAVKAFWDIAVF